MGVRIDYEHSQVNESSNEKQRVKSHWTMLTSSCDEEQDQVIGDDLVLLFTTCDLLLLFITCDLVLLLTNSENTSLCRTREE